MRVEDLGLDGRISQILASQGITELYPPQQESIGPALEGKNLVLAIPTASGKSLVAYLAILKSVLNGGKALYIVPLRALAREKYDDLRSFEPLGLRVALAMGDYDTDDPTLQRYDIIIATSEKADSLLRHRSHWLGQLTVVVADEVHLINDGGRGPTLEVTLAKIRQVNPKAQVIALSATIANSYEIAEWLGAEHVKSEWRPVPLKAGVSVANRIFWSDQTVKYLLESGDDLEVLVKDSLKDGGQCLIFVNTRQSTETMARRLVKSVAPFLPTEEMQALGTIAEEEVATQAEPTSFGARLSRCLRGGTAFHHAGLTNDQRKIVEENFKKGTVKVIVATPTLCLHPNTLITTRRGPVRISEITEGDEVLTHLGRFRKVLGTTKRPFKGPLLEIKADGMMPVLMTPEHRVLRNMRFAITLCRGGETWRQTFRSETDWVLAAELCKGDEVVSPIETAEFEADGGGFLLHLHSKTFIGRNQFGASFPHPTSKPVPCDITVDQKTAELLGLYVAEGFTNRTGAVRFAIATYEDDLTRFILDHLTRIFHVSPVVFDSDRHRRIVGFYSNVLATFFDRNFGRGARNKHFPEQLLDAPLPIIQGLVKGAWLGDGSIRTSPWARAEYVTISPWLAEQLLRMLKRLGYMPSVSTTAPRGFGKHKQYHLWLAGTQGKRFLVEVMGVNATEIRDGDRTYNMKNLFDNTFRSPIRKIGSLDYEGDVYNLHVEGDESYTCSFAFAVHNSAGINLPARRVIVRDTRRYDSNYGYTPLPVIEIKQMCGRAGRPKYDTYGEAVLVARHEEDAEFLQEAYLDAEPEAVESKLGTEPALRVHILAVIATEHVRTEAELFRFMERTFYAHQGDVQDIEGRIHAVLNFLEEEGFIRRGEFLNPTLFGRRTSDLYIDPLSAVELKKALTSKEEGSGFSYLHAICATPDMPKLYLRQRDYEWVEAKLTEEEFLVKGEDYDFLLAEVKTAALLEAWTEEATEDEIVKKFKVGPGDIRRMVDNAQWLLHSMHELARIFNRDRMKPLAQLMPRVRYGIREDALDLINLRGIGRVRARVLLERRIRTREDLRNVTVEWLSRLPSFGLALAQSLLGQLGVAGSRAPVEESPKKEGQFAIHDFE